MRYANELNTDTNHQKWQFCEEKTTPRTIFVLTDSGPENYSGLSCSRPGTTAPAGPGRFCTMPSRKITTHNAHFWRFSPLCLCVLSGIAVSVPGLGEPQCSEAHTSGAAAVRQQSAAAERESAGRLGATAAAVRYNRKQQQQELVTRLPWPLCASSLRLAAVHAGRHAEPPGQQRGAHQTDGYGGGRVSELPHEHQRNQAEVWGNIDVFSLPLFRVIATMLWEWSLVCHHAVL